MKHLIGIHAAGFSLAAVYGAMALLAEPKLGLSLINFGRLIMLAFAFYAAVCFWTTRQKQPITIKALLAWSLVFRLIGWCGQPILEDDYFRYLWDGYRLATQGTPYGQAPSAFFSDTTVDKALVPALDQINHPDIPTLYGPAFEYVFGLAYWLAPGQLWPLKLLLSGIDMGLIVLLLRLTTPAKTLLYAWNPLVIKEIAFTAHPDGLIPALLLSSWLLTRRCYYLPAGLALAAAISAKVSGWLMLPFFGLVLGRRGLSAFAVGYFLLYLPFLWQGATGLDGLTVFAQQFEFNSALFGIAQLWLPGAWAKKILGVLFLAGVGAYWLRYRRQHPNPALPRGDWLFGGLLLVSPVINPWYLLWLLPFAAVYPSVTAWVASAAVLLSYATGLNLEDPSLTPYQHPAWVRPVEFGLITVALAVDCYLATIKTRPTRG